MSSFFSKAVEVSNEVEEFSYEQLLDKIKTKQKRIVKKASASPWDQVYLYPGFSLIHSYTKISHEKAPNFYHAGLQVSLGMDLFSDHWYSETAFRNFGVTKTETSELFLKELDFKVGHKNYLSDLIEYRIALGVSTRTIRISDETTGLHIESKNPALISSLGLFSAVNSSPVSLGVEVNLRNLLVNSDFDKGSAGFNFLFMGYF